MGPESRDELLGHRLFEGVRAEAVAPLLGRVLVRKLPKGKVLHSPGQHGPLNLVLRGELRAYQLTGDGRRLLLEMMGPGGVDGILPMLGERGHFTEASRDSLVGCIEWPLLQELIEADPHVARNLVELVAERLEHREEHLEWMVIRDPSRRLARQLVALASAVGESVGSNGALQLPRPVTHQMLADMLGMRRETVTIHLRKLARLGGVEPHGRPIVVHRERLRAIAARDS